MPTEREMEGEKREQEVCRALIVSPRQSRVKHREDKVSPIRRTDTWNMNCVTREYLSVVSRSGCVLF